MKKTKEFKHKKEFIALVLLILLLILIRSALLYIGAKLGEVRENELIQLKMGALSDIVSDANDRRAAASERIGEKLAANTRLMTALLRSFCTEEGYTGPRTVPDGFVAELRGDRVILPEEAEAFSPVLTRELIERGLRRAQWGTNSLMAVSTAEEEPVPYFLSFSELAEDLVYVDLITEKEYAEILDRYCGQIDDVLETADASFGGITLVVSVEDGRLRVVRQFGTLDGLEELLDSVLAPQTLRRSTSVLTVNGKDYQCSSSRLDDGGTGEETQYILQIIPLVSLSEQNVTRSLLVVLLMAVICAAVAVYMISAQRRAADPSVREKEAAHYAPRHMCKRMVAVGLLSVVVIFAAAVLVESVGQLYMELRYGRDTLRLFSGQIEKESLDRLTDISMEEDSWYVYYGELMAPLLSENPELATPAKLQEYCDALGIDCIMLFDSAGREVSCNRDYVGFTLGDGPEDALYEFNRLRYGLPSVILEPAADSQLGWDRQLVGVKLPAPELGNMHGVLVMALQPDSMNESDLVFASDRRLSLGKVEGTVCFAADSATGEILFSNSASMLGRTVSQLGLRENSLQNGYMDFTAIGGTKYLVVTVSEGGNSYYYAVDSATIFEQVILYGILAALFFALLLALLLVFLLREYKKSLEGSPDASAEEEAGPTASRLNTDEMNAVTLVSEEEAEQEGEKKDGILRKLLDYLEWDRLSPGRRAAIVIRVGLIILILCCLDVLNGKGLSNDAYGSMLGFLLNGDWLRGLNLFSLCTMLVIISIAYLINLLSNLLLVLTALVLTGQGETVCKLLYSCVKYITVLGVIYFCLEYLGFPTSTILAALGSVSLAISLGAQDLIADILAGLAVVFDGSFRVGDVVEINGKTGTVLELGVRATRIRVPVNNIMVINNHKITDILNLSLEYSEAQTSVRIYIRDSLPRLEEILRRELPEIGKKESKILYGPYLIGVTDLPDKGSVFKPSVTVSVGAMCDEKNKGYLRNYLNRELKLLAEREELEFY